MLERKNMDNSFSLKILESYIEIDKIQDEINNMIFHFINDASKLIELSDDDYQIEKTFRLNKIALKQYILDSDCCKQLHDNHITDYSLDKLKNYLLQYSTQFNVDCSSYFLAISLYEMIEKIEDLFDEKINLEIQDLSKLLSNINDIKNINSSEYEQLYFQLKNQISFYFNSQKIDEKSMNICIKMLDDIFNFYINGYPNIPEEYLYHSEN